ncbi:MAG: hypothetical protein R8M11_03250 [Gallionella sp.]
MKPLLIKFELRLVDLSIDNAAISNGPLFHCWLPNGVEDAIEIKIGNKDSILKIFFERCGIIEGKFIEFKLSKLKDGHEVISKQARLDGGPLFAELIFHDYTNSELQAVESNKQGEADYIALAKKVIELSEPHFEHIIDILRISYGQYWIEEFQKFDSRKQSIGNYCSTNLGMRWSIDNGTTWTAFLPDENRITHNPLVPSSSLGRPTIKTKACRDAGLLFF